MRVLCFVFFAGSFLFAEPVEKAVKYHELLLKNADNETLMERFLDSWLDEQEREDLEGWLQAEVEAGGVAERRVLARYFDHVGIHERALREYEAVLKVEPGDAKTQLAVAKLRAGGLDFEGALKILEGRDDVEAVTLRGAWEHRLGNTKVALELWRGLLEKKPGERELREDLVSLFRQEGLGKEARELQEELMEMGDDPFQRALDQLDLGDLQLEGGLREAALGSYREVLAVSGGSSWMEREALHKLGEIFRQERNAEGLRVFLAKLREEMPHRLTLQKSFARQLVITGEVDEGVAGFREILRRAPGDEKLRLEFVELLAFAERFEEAAEELEVIIASDATAENWVRLAELKKEFDVDEVLVTLGEVEKLKSWEAAGILEMARLYDRFELKDEALRVLRNGRGKFVESREISEALAVFLVEGDGEKEALAIWLEMAKKGDLKEALRVAQSMRRHGFGREAYEVLEGEGEGLEEKFEGLRLYCELAFEVGEIESAWTGVQRLILLPEGFSDLQEVVRLGSSIGMKHGLEESISELADAKEENALCLLANLYQLAGRLPEADAVLDRAVGEFARRYRVVLLTQRRDFAGAIGQLRGLMEGRVTLVERKQLLSLLERQGNLEGALEEAEKWKIASPGEVAAWKKRAKLLVQLGRQAEAAAELRRARNTFGRDDVELTRELAKMQLPLGKHREALRLYEHLFRIAKTDGERLKLIDEMYAAGREAGLEYEMISRFEREHERAKLELFPLRLLSQLYKLSHNSGGQQEVLLKLHRLLPDDEIVLFELVALAEANHDSAGAQRLLMEHAARTQSAGVLQRLAAVQIKAGEVEKGLEILGKIAPGDLTAGDVEGTALTLWRMGEHQIVLEFLEEHEEAVAEDWRLKSVYSDFLARVGREDEARKIWVELLGEEGVLGRPVSSSVVHRRTIHIPVGGQINQWSWWQWVGNDPSSGIFYGNGSAHGVNLPNDAREARWWSLVRLARASLRNDPSGKEWEAFLGTLNHPWLDRVRGWGLAQKMSVPPVVSGGVKEAEVAKVVMSPEMRLSQLVGSPESTREDLLTLAMEVEGEKPGLATTCRIHAAFKLPEGPEKMAALRVVANQIAKEGMGPGRNAMIYTQLVGVQIHFGILPVMGEEQISSEQEEKLKLLKPWWDGWTEGVIAGNHVVSRGFLFPLGVQRLSGDLEGFFENLDRLVEAKLVVQAVSPWSGQSLAVAPVTSGRYSRPLQGIPQSSSLLSHLASQHPVYSPIHQTSSRKMMSPELLKTARELGWEPKGYGKLEEFAKRVPQVKDGFLRALLFEKLGMREEFLAEMDALGREGGLEEKLDALVLRRPPGERGGNEDLLGKLLGMDRAGLDVAGQSLLDAVTLGEAQKNRHLRDMDGKLKADLEEILMRHTKGPGGRSKVAQLSSLFHFLGLEVPHQKRLVKGQRSLQRQSYRQLLRDRNREGFRKGESEYERKERDFLNRLKSSFASSNALESLRLMIRRSDFPGFQEKALSLYEPGESKSYLKRIRYAQLCLVCDQQEKAREVLERLKAERPYDDEARILFFFAQEADERNAKLDEIGKSGEVARVINLLTKLAELAEDEEMFFDAYERLVVLMEARAGEFRRQDGERIFQIFQRFGNMRKGFGKRSLYAMSSRLPKVKQGEDSKEGDWALRIRQRKIILDACGEMMRMRSVRGRVLNYIRTHKDALRLNDGNVEWMVFDALAKEPVMEVGGGGRGPGLGHYPSSQLGRPDGYGIVALKAVQGSERFSAESVDHLVRHAFLSEKQGRLVKAALERKVGEVERLLAEHQEEEAKKLKKFAPGVVAESWVAFLDALLRSRRLDESVKEVLEKGMGEIASEHELVNLEFWRVCELGELKDSLAVLEAVAAAHFPAAQTFDSYQKLKAVTGVPSEVEDKIKVGKARIEGLQSIPRAWIPLLTFLRESDLAVWVSVDEKRLRTRLSKQLDVKYKRVFYDRLRAEGFSSYDGLAFLGEERLTKTGENSTWLEELISPLELSPTEGRTYWINVSEDCREQVEEVTYLEAFIAMRKDFKIDDEERRKVLRAVLESELEKLNGLEDGQLRGLANLIRRDFPKLEVPEASEELEGLLERVRNFPAEGVVERIAKMMLNDKELAGLGDDEAKGLCARLAGEGGVELAAEFWVAFLKVKESGRRQADFGNLNFTLVARKPFQGTLNLVDSVRFVRLVREAFKERPEVVKGITYTRDMLEWRKAFGSYSGHKGDPGGVIRFLEEMLKGDEVTEADKRVLGGFLIKANVSGRSAHVSREDFRLRLEESTLAKHSPGIVETMLTLSQLQGAREKEEDVKALKVLFGYLRDQDLEPDFRADLAECFMEKMERDAALREPAAAEAIGVALRDLLLRGYYGSVGNLHTGGPMMYFVNQHLGVVPAELQRELYDGWMMALKEDARKVLNERVGPNRKLRLLDIIFDFVDGGKRFPLPPQLIAELGRSFSGDLETMQRLIRTGNAELIQGLVPDANRGFRLHQREYSGAARVLEKEVLPELHVGDQVMLKSYLATLRDSNDWITKKESVGHLQQDRAVAAAEFFVENPPEDQAARVRVVNYLDFSVEALRVLMPLFTKELQDDLPAIAKNHRGDFRYMLNWVEAGGAETVHSFASTKERSLRLSGVSHYSKALGELENLLAPSLAGFERMALLCDLALLRDPAVEEGKKPDFPARNIRVENAARYILENPLPGEQRDLEKSCIAKLLKGGLSEGLAQKLMQRDSKDLGKLDVTVLASMRRSDSELLAYQLRGALMKGDAAATMSCLRILADPETKIPKRQYEELINGIMPKVAVRLVNLVAQAEAGEEGKKRLLELKALGAGLFQKSFGASPEGGEAARRAVLFLAFATHCLTGDKKGFEALEESASDEGKRSLLELQKKRQYGGFGRERMLPLSREAQPFQFDGVDYSSDDLKGLRKLLFDKIREHSFAGESSATVLMSGLRLTLADVELEEDVIASERGDIDAIVTAIVAGEDALFLALLPTEEEVYFRRDSQPDDSGHIRSSRGLSLPRLERHWMRDPGKKILDLIESEFQRMHFEVFLQSVMSGYYTRGVKYDLGKLDAEMEKKILALIPESGPARAQVIARLGRVTEPGSELGKVLVAEAVAGDCGPRKAANHAQTIAEADRLTTFLYGWICALHEGDWSLLDRQFQSKPDQAAKGFLSRCACVQALFTVAGDASLSEDVLKKLGSYGVDQTDLELKAWMEVIGMVSGAKTSGWKDELEALDAVAQRQAREEMVSGLRSVLGLITSVKIPRSQYFLSEYSWSEQTMKVWIPSLTLQEGERVLAAIMNDGSGLFSAAKISAEGRVRLMLKAFDWQPLKGCIEASFEGEMEVRLLSELALANRPPADSREAFYEFTRNLVSRVNPESQERSKLLGKVVHYYISAKDLEGAREAREQINPVHLNEHELKNLDRQLDMLKQKAE